MDRIYLQPLRVPAGWTIYINVFFEVDPTNEFIDYFDSSFPLLGGYSNTMQLSFYLEYEQKGIPFGDFILVMMNNVDNSIESEVIDIKETKCRKQIIELIENFMLHGK